MFLHSQCIISGSYLSIAAANLQLTLLGEEGSSLPNSDSRCDKKTETEEKLSCMPDEHHAKNFNIMSLHRTYFRSRFINSIESPERGHNVVSGILTAWTNE